MELVNSSEGKRCLSNNTLSFDDKLEIYHSENKVDTTINQQLDALDFPSKDIEALIRAMVSKDPAKRPDIAHVIEAINSLF